jgi:hypothetical protein
VTGDQGGPADVPSDPGPGDTGSDPGPGDTGSDPGPGDTGVTDTGATDTGLVDTGATDTAGTDTGATDTGATDTGPDAGGGGSPLMGVVVFNEVLTDGATDGDPNGDGDAPDSVGDEFVEIVNGGTTAVDLAGFTLVETSLPALPRHTFAAGTTLAAGEAIVVFGGGTAPDDITGAAFVVANAADPGIPFGLSLDNTADVLQLLDASGLLVAEFAYGGAAPLAAVTDESYTRDPAVTGAFVPHSTATGAAGAIFSPGTAVDGTNF